MSKTYISVNLRRLVEERAASKCEYCQIPSAIAFFPHEIDHVVAEKHEGKTNESNLALTCWRCNRHKGTDLGSFDPQTEEFCFLFNPRTQTWSVAYETSFELSETDRVGIAYSPASRASLNLCKAASEYL